MFLFLRHVSLVSNWFRTMTPFECSLDRSSRVKDTISNASIALAIPSLSMSNIVPLDVSDCLFKLPTRVTCSLICPRCVLLDHIFLNLPI